MNAPTLDLTNIPEDAHAIAEKVNAQLASAMDMFRVPDPFGGPFDAPAAPSAAADPVQDPAPEAPAAPETPEPPADEQPTTPEPDPAPTTPTLDITPEEIERLRALESWARQLDPQTQVQMAGITTGQAVAVPTDEFARYRAWVASQQPSPSSPTANFSLDELDPEQARYVQQLQAENAALAAERERLERERQQLLVPDQLAAQQQSERVIADTMSEYARINGFDEQTVGALLDQAVQLNAFAMFVGANREINPVTGQILREAPLDVVTRQALDFARVQRPDLIAGSTAPAPVNTTIPAPTTSPADDAVARKKANAASLAAAPSAATAPPAIDPRTLDPGSQRSLIADMIRQSVPGTR